LPHFRGVQEICFDAHNTCAANNNGVTATATDMESLTGFGGGVHISIDINLPKGRIKECLYNFATCARDADMRCRRGVK